MKKLTLFIAIISLCSFSYAQNQPSQNIRGQIRDKETQEAIPGATISITNSTILTVTKSDLDGKFLFKNVPVGRVDLKISSIGYEDQNINGLLLGSGKELILNIQLEEKFVKTQEVVVQADRNTNTNEMATVSARSFSVEESKRYAASVNDPARMALSYAGVANNGDFDNGIVIRGNAPRGLLWRLEGVEIPNPNHFASNGASGGSISMMSANTMTNSDFYVGAFPAEYGNALSGVFDIKLRNGNDQKNEYAFQFGLLGVDLSVEGPIKQSSSSYLVNYRYSTLKMFDAIGIKIGGDAVPDFQDLTWKVYMPTKKFGTFSFFGLYGANKVAQSDTDYRFTNEERLLSTGLSNLYIFKNNKTYIKSILSISETKGNDYEENRDDFGNFFESFSQNSTNRYYRFSSFINHKFNVQHVLRAGIIINEYDFDVNLNFYDYDDDILKNYYNQNGNTSNYQAYMQYKYKASEKLSMTAGLHGNFFKLNNTYNVEPRIGMQYDMNSMNIFTAGIGFHSRLESIADYYTKVMQADSSYLEPNRNLRSSKSIHYIAGYKRIINEFVNLKVESYYQHLYDIPVSNKPGSSFSLINFDGGLNDLALENKGTGTNYGVEFTLERPLKNNLYYLVTLSLFNSTYEDYQGRTFSARFNNNYLFNVLIGKEWKLRNNNILGANIRSIYAGGLRITPIDLEASKLADKAVYRETEAFTDRVANYFRPDIRVSYKINKAKASHEISLDVQNCINRLNVYGQYYDIDKKEIVEIYQLGLIPLLNYRIEF